MSYKIDIWFPFHIPDNLSETMSFDAELFGAYALLQTHYWKSGCRLDNNTEELLRVTRLNSSENGELKLSRVLKLFEEKRGRLIHARLDKEYEKSTEIQASNSHRTQAARDALERKRKAEKESAPIAVEESVKESVTENVSKEVIETSTESATASQLQTHTQPPIKTYKPSPQIRDDYPFARIQRAMGKLSDDDTYIIQGWIKRYDCNLDDISLLIENGCHAYLQKHGSKPKGIRYFEKPVEKAFRVRA